MKFNSNNYIKYIIYIVLIAVLITPFFYKLDSYPIKLWDESRYAQNAFEMQFSDNPLVVTFNGKPDYWNSKPPLAIWLMHISFKVFGYNELGVRMPSAIAGVLVIFLVLFYSKRVTGNNMPGIFSALTIASTSGIIRFHGTRTGDVDGLLTLFIVLYGLSYIAFLLSDRKHARLYITLFGIGVLMAFLTKGIAALVPLPGLLIISFLYKNYTKVFKFSYLYLVVFIVGLIGIGYYWMRSLYDEGYIDAIFNQDLKMFDNEKSIKSFGFYFYYEQIIDKYFYPFAFYLPISLFLSFFTKNIKLKRFLHYVTIFFVVFVFIHSCSSTMNIWYDLPAYPFMAILFGGSLSIVYELLYDRLARFSSNIRTVLVLVFSFLIFIYPSKKLYENLKPTQKIYHKEWEGRYMRHLKNHRPEIKQYTVSSFKIWPDQIIFYRNIYKQEFGINTKINNKLKFEDGEKVLTCHKAVRDYIHEHYNYSIVDSKDACRLYEILSKKE